MLPHGGSLANTKITLHSRLRSRCRFAAHVYLSVCATHFDRIPLWIRRIRLVGQLDGSRRRFVGLFSDNLQQKPIGIVARIAAELLGVRVAVEHRQCGVGGVREVGSQQVIAGDRRDGGGIAVPETAIYPG